MSNKKKQYQEISRRPVEVTLSNSSKAARKGLVFTPIGGVGEIGGNCYAYGYQDQWIVVDYGIAFPDHVLFGAEVELPDLSFFADKRDKILAIIVTHAHEDHIGGLAYLWSELNAPVYATDFAGSFLRYKLKDSLDDVAVPIHLLRDHDEYTFGPFTLRALPMSHSIPEARLLAMRTPQGLIVHTGDWSGDSVAQAEENKMFEALAAEQVDYMIGDSTNVLSQNSTHDRMTEDKVKQNLQTAIAACQGRVIVTCFASNVTRMESIAHAALDSGRQIALVGRSMWRINHVAREVGYFETLPAFKTAKDLENTAHKQCLYIVTGSQAEPRAALTRMAAGTHPELRLKPDDTVLYSSREIPGNEKDIAQVHNQLALMGIKVIPADPAGIHASGHASQELTARLIRIIKPKVVIPVHGEGRHLVAHADLAKQCGAQQALLVNNGDIVQFHQGRAQIIDQVRSGKWAMDGHRLIASNSTIMKERKRIASQGSISIAIAVDEHGQIVGEPNLSCVGLLEEQDEQGYDALYDTLDEACKVFRSTSPQAKLNKHCEAVEKAMRHGAKRIFGKRPWVQVILLEVS